jgi:hypothetical protein
MGRRTVQYPKLKESLKFPMNVRNMASELGFRRSFSAQQLENGVFYEKDDNVLECRVNTPETG